MNLNMQVDSESEELSIEVLPLAKSNNLTRSVFNLTIELPSDETQTDNTRIEYVNRLNDELLEWNCQLKKIRKEAKNAKAIDTVDLSVLSPEKLAYLNTAPDLTKFLEESIEFRKEATVYLEVDYAEVLEIHENLMELCKDRLDTKKSLLIEEFIFKVSLQAKNTKKN